MNFFQDGVEESLVAVVVEIPYTNVLFDVQLLRYLTNCLVARFLGSFGGQTPSQEVN